MNGDLKLTFIQKCLAEYMQSVVQAIPIAAKRAGVGVTDAGIKSLSYEAFQLGAGGSANLSFHEYLRFVDMGAGRGHPLGGLRTMAVTLQASNRTGLVQVKDKMRKPKKIYSRIAYGKLNWFENKLLHGYTEETIRTLKLEMQNPD
jgi:hypothetical protein